MKSVPIVFIICALYSSHGQLSDFGRYFTRELSNQPLLRTITRLTENTVSSTLNALTRLPVTISRSLFPILITPNQDELDNRIIAEYNASTGNEDARLSITQLLTKYGKPVQEHRVLTDDGYKLKMHRIPSNGSVVFLMHGLLGSSDDFIIAGPEKGLAYLLADEGYDVWMGNARGNKHSRRHVNLKPAEPSFWNFSWHEIGFHDLPAMINYVLAATGREQLKYIGHSQGTTTFFVMASEKPEFNDKISVMVALSPVAFMTNVRSPVVRVLATGGPLVYVFSRSLGLYEYFPDNPLIRSMRELMCGLGSLSEILCSNALFLFTGFGFDQLDVKNLPVLFGHTPSGASLKQFFHYGQGVTSTDFRHFDYGKSENMRRYDRRTPPSYNLKRITAPVSLFYSDEDWLAHPADVDQLYNKLGNCVDMYKVPHNQFNHIDFLFGKDCKKLIYERLSKLLIFYDNDLRNRNSSQNLSQTSAEILSNVN